MKYCQKEGGAYHSSEGISFLDRNEHLSRSWFRCLFYGVVELIRIHPDLKLFA
jgi:hypothetical protein